jgi:hypothetical protein
LTACLSVMAADSDDEKGVQAVMAQAFAVQQLEFQHATTERMYAVCVKRCVAAPVDGKLGDKHRHCLNTCSSLFSEGFEVAVSLGIWGFIGR